MKKKFIFTLNDVLYFVIGLILLLIIVGTILAFSTDKAEPGKNLRNSDPSPKEALNLNDENQQKISAYTGIGTLRCVTAPEISEGESKSGSTIAVTPWFSYPENDNDFYEEMSRKHNILCGTITSFFAEFTKDELMKMGEEKIKDELKNQLNSKLVLSKITKVYFTDYIFFD